MLLWKNESIHPWSIKHQESGIKHQASSIEHQASSIKHQASSIKHQASSIKHQASSIKHQASSIKHQESGIKHQASNIKHQALSIKNQPSNIKHQASDIKHHASGIKQSSINSSNQTIIVCGIARGVQAIAHQKKIMYNLLVISCPRKLPHLQYPLKEKKIWSVPKVLHLIPKWHAICFCFVWMLIRPLWLALTSKLIFFYFEQVKEAKRANKQANKGIKNWLPSVLK